MISYSGTIVINLVFIVSKEKEKSIAETEKLERQSRRSPKVSPVLGPMEGLSRSQGSRPDQPGVLLLNPSPTPRLACPLSMSMR